MIRQNKVLVAWISAAACFVTLPLYAQQGANTGGAAGARTAGSASTLSASQGYGLDTRFMGSGFDIYTQGSAGLGSTTAGARAGSAGFGQATTGGAMGTTLGNTGTRGGGFGFGNFGGMNSFGGLGGLGAFGLGRSMFGNRNMQATQANKMIRTRTKLGFTQPLPPSSVVTSNYSGVMRRVFERGDYGKGEVSLSLEGEIAVLRGTVDSDHARDIAERLVLLEPGIAEVRNELIVRAAEPTRGTSPTATGSGQRQ